MTIRNLLCKEGIDDLRNKSFLDLCTEGGATSVDGEDVMLYLAACLGFIKPGCDNWKDILYVRDPVTTMLCDIRSMLVSFGVLRYDQEKDVYFPVNLTEARVIDVSGYTDNSLHDRRAYELLDKKLLWPEELQLPRDNPTWMEELPAGIGQVRVKFATRLYWDTEYPTDKGSRVSGS
jgi:hypothetical protein